MTDHVNDKKQMMQWRGIRNEEDACRMCNGSGRRCYGDTSTWRGGMGGCAMTWDVCDKCWGSGDRYCPGVDLRVLRDQESKRVAERAINLLANSCGVGLANGAVWDIVVAIEDLANRAAKPRRGAQKAYNEWTYNMARGLARALRAGIGRPATEESADE